VFYSIMALLQGTPHLALAHIGAKLAPTMQACWSIWPFVHYLNFR
jgi:hypothetical protein